MNYDEWLQLLAGSASREQAARVLREDAFSLFCMHESLLTEELCLAAVKTNGHLLQAVPPRLRTERVKKAAIDHAPSSFRYLSDDEKDAALCEVAVRMDPTNLFHVPMPTRTRDIDAANNTHHVDHLYKSSSKTPTYDVFLKSARNVETSILFNESMEYDHPHAELDVLMNRVMRRVGVARTARTDELRIAYMLSHSGMFSLMEPALRHEHWTEPACYAILCKHPQRNLDTITQHFGGACSARIERFHAIQGASPSVLDERDMYFETVSDRNVTHPPWLITPRYIDALLPTRFRLLALCDADAVGEEACFNSVLHGFKSNLDALHTIPTRLLTPKIVNAILCSNKANVAHMPHELISDREFEMCIYTNPELMFFLPPERRTADLCKVAMDQSPYALVHVPSELLASEAFRPAVIEALELDEYLYHLLPESLASHPQFLRYKTNQTRLDISATGDRKKKNGRAYASRMARNYRRIHADQRTPHRIVSADESLIPYHEVPTWAYTPQICNAICVITKNEWYECNDDPDQPLDLSNLAALELEMNVFDARHTSEPILTGAISLAAHYFPDQFAPHLAHILSRRRLGSLPRHLRTAEACNTGLQAHPSSLKFVPPEHMTPEMCDHCVSADPRLLCFVPDALKTADMCKQAVAACASTLQFVPKALADQTMRSEAFAADVGTLMHFPAELITGDMCIAFLERYRLWVRAVPDHVWQQSEYKDRLLALVHPDYRTQAGCDTQFAVDPLNIEYVPEPFRTEAMCRSFVRGYLCCDADRVFVTEVVLEACLPHSAKLRAAYQDLQLDAVSMGATRGSHALRHLPRFLARSLASDTIKSNAVVQLLIDLNVARLFTPLSFEIVYNHILMRTNRFQYINIIAGLLGERRAALLRGARSANLIDI